MDHQGYYLERKLFLKLQFFLLKYNLDQNTSDETFKSS